MAGTSIRIPFDDADANIIFRSADHIDFRLYKVILAKASTVFRDMLAIPDVNAGTGEPQIVEVTEDANTLENLLRFCYPVKRAVFSTVDEVLTVFTAAKKYNIKVAVDTTRCAVEDLAEKESAARIYVIACVHELPTLARRAARLLVREPDFMGLPSVPLELRPLTPGVLYIFARYRNQCLTAVRDVLEGNHKWLWAGDHAYKVQYSKKLVPEVVNSWIWYRCSTCSRNPFEEITITTPSVFAKSSTIYPRLWWTYYEATVKETLLCEGLDGGVATRKVKGTTVFPQN